MSLPTFDTPQAAAALVIGAVLTLAVIRRGFGGVSVKLG